MHVARGGGHTDVAPAYHCFRLQSVLVSPVHLTISGLLLPPNQFVSVLSLGEYFSVLNVKPCLQSYKSLKNTMKKCPTETPGMRELVTGGGAAIRLELGC